MNEKTIIDRVEYIRRTRKERGLPVSRLAELAGLRASTLQEMDTEGWNPQLRTLAAIERALMGQQEVAAE